MFQIIFKFVIENVEEENNPQPQFNFKCKKLFYFYEESSINILYFQDEDRSIDNILKGLKQEENETKPK